MSYVNERYLPIDLRFVFLTQREIFPFPSELTENTFLGVHEPELKTSRDKPQCFNVLKRVKTSDKSTALSNAD